MDILTTIKNRRSIRQFQDKSIPEEIINELIEALIWAPSAGNLQARKFYFVYQSEKREALAKAGFGPDFIRQAPLVVVACTDDIIERRYGQRGKQLYAICDVAMSVENMILLAYARGLGSVVVGDFNEGEVINLLKMPENLWPIMLVPVGYPAEQPKPPIRVSKDGAVIEVK